MGVRQLRSSESRAQMAGLAASVGIQEEGSDSAGTSQALSPSPMVRVASFWFLPAAVACGLKNWPAFQEKSISEQVLGYTLGFFSTIWMSAYWAASWQMKRLPSSKELAQIGGKQFVRPSDGKLLEYWLSGKLGSTTVVVFCHRMDGKVGADYAREKVAHLLDMKDACLLSPSVPSLSASPPYSTDSPVQWLQQWNQDMLALLHQLGATDVHVLGLSWGSQPCANLAMALQEKGMLRSVGMIGAALWERKGNSWTLPEQTGTVASIFSKKILIKPLAYLMIRPMIPYLSNLELLGETEVPYIKKYFGDDVQLFGTGSVRSMSFFLHQNWQVTRTCLLREAEEYVEWTKFDPSIPFHFNVGSKDQLTGAAHPEYKQLMEHAKVIEYDG